MTARARPTALVITPDFPPANGGIQLFTQRVVAAWRELEPLVVTLGHPDAARFDREQGFEILRVPAHGPRVAAVTALNAAALGLAARRRPAVVLSAHIVAAPAAAALRRRRGVGFVQCCYADELTARPGLARFAVTRADRIVAISAHTRELALAVGAPAQRVVIIHPGVDLPAPATATGTEAEAQAEAEADRVAIAARPPTVLTVSRLAERYKGHDVIMRAMPLVRAKLPTARWRVVGDGALRGALEARCRALGLDGDAVEFTGGVGNADRDRELGSADVLCMVSRVAPGAYAGEGFGITYLEAGAHGLPVVAGDAGGATDAVIGGQTGLLVDPEDHVAVAEALVAVLSDPPLAQRLGRAGRVRAQQLSWTATAARIERELLGLVA